MLPFPHFEVHIDPVILQRGRAYFEEEAVCDVYKSTKNKWTASVMGSELYEVAIVVKEDAVTRWECTCPYDGGPICKHVVAALYAIKDKNPTAEDTLPQKRSKDSAIESIIKSLSTKHLKEALLYACKQYPQLGYELQARYTEGDKVDKHLIATTINQALKKAQDHYGYIRYDKVSALKRTTANFIDRAAADLQQGYYRNTIDILLALIETTVPILESTDDSSGVLSAMLEQAFLLLEELATADLPPQLADELLTYCLRAFEDKRYKGWDWQWQWPYIAIALIRNSEEADQLLQLLDKELPKTRQTWINDFDAERVARVKLALFEKVQPQKMASFIEEHLSFPSFREMAIQTAYNNNNLQKAEVLCQEGIKDAESKRLPGLVNHWYKWLLTIAQQQKNQPTVITAATYLLRYSHEKRTYYDLLRSIWPTNEWATHRKQYIRLLQQSQAIDTLIEIYIDEKEDKELEKLLKQTGSLDLLLLYIQPLLEQSPHVVKNLLAPLVYTYMEYSTSRSHYKKIGSLLKNVKQKLEAIDVIPIVEKLRKLYPQRRALLDELKSV